MKRCGSRRSLGVRHFGENKLGTQVGTKFGTLVTALRKAEERKLPKLFRGTLGELAERLLHRS